MTTDAFDILVGSLFILGAMHVFALNWGRSVAAMAAWLRNKFASAHRADPINQAKQLSLVLQIPIVDAELTLELSRAFFHPTDNPELNSEAVELFLASCPRNQTWRTRAGECCRKLRALELSPTAKV
jgi:hypothetical protein